MLFDTFLLVKVFSTICFLQLPYDNNFFHVDPYFFKSIYVPSKVYLMQLETTSLYSLHLYTFIFLVIFQQDAFSKILLIFIFHAKVIFSGFLSFISQLFTVFWKFLSCFVLFFHEILYCIPVLLYPKFASLVFLDIAQDCSLGQCLTSGRAETSKKVFLAQIRA